VQLLAEPRAIERSTEARCELEAGRGEHLDLLDDPRVRGPLHDLPEALQPILRDGTELRRLGEGPPGDAAARPQEVEPRDEAKDGGAEADRRTRPAGQEVVGGGEEVARLDLDCVSMSALTRATIAR
jgi:hypothetical protein